MTSLTPIDNEELLEKLTQEVADWEHSPFYLEDKELFDIERFLLDHNGSALKKELEETYGSPLNEKFWSASLAYQRLKKLGKWLKGRMPSKKESGWNLLSRRRKTKRPGNDY